MNSEDRNAISQFIHDFISWLKTRLNGEKVSLKIVKLENRFAAVLRNVDNANAQKNNTTNDGDVQYEFNENLYKQLNDWLKGGGRKNGAYNGSYFELGTTPNVLIKHGAPAVNVIMYSDVITKITGGKHSIALDEIAKLPIQLNDPILLFKGSVPNSFVALTELVDKNGNDVIVAVHINKHLGRTVINKIASLYSKSDDYGNNKIIEYIKRQILAGNLIDASNIKAPNWFTSRGLQLPKEVQTILDANNKISQKDKVVNTHYTQEGENYSSPEQNNDGNSYSFGDNERYAEYDKPITPGDIRLLREIGRKSINEFTPEEIEIAQKWAYKFYQQLGTKSPFFRRWFGDWRACDISPANIVSFAYAENPKLNYAKRYISCKELKTRILVDETVINDSLHYAKENGDEKQIRKLLGKIDEIVENGILLDTQISTHSSGNKKGSTQFMHYLYTPISVNGAPFIAKLSIEEYDLTGKKRAYNIQRIELSEVSRAQYSQLIEENRGKFAYTSDALSVAQLFNLVKTYDTKFKPNPVNEALIENGKPKMLYHQTESEFTEFDITRKGAGSSDNETPFGIFLKETDKDIGLKGKRQMPLFAKMNNPLIVENREALVYKAIQLSKEYENYYNKSKQIDMEYSKKHEDAIKAFNDFIIENSKSDNRKSRQELYDDSEFQRLFDAEDQIVEEWQKVNRENDLKAKEALTLALKNNNYDGVILKKDVGSFGRVTEAYIVFDKTQVKSAEDGGNIGTFSEAENDIRYSFEDDVVDKTSSLAERVRLGEISQTEYLNELQRLMDEATEKYGAIPKGENPVVSNIS